MYSRTTICTAAQHRRLSPPPSTRHDRPNESNGVTTPGRVPSAASTVAFKTSPSAADQISMTPSAVWTRRVASRRYSLRSRLLRNRGLTSAYRSRNLHTSSCGE